MSAKRVVIILNDRRDAFKSIVLQLRDMNLTALGCISLQEGWTEFLENQDALAIFVDGNMHPIEGQQISPGEPVTSEEFVFSVRKRKYGGHLYAASAKCNPELIRAGCERGCQVHEIPRIVRELLAAEVVEKQKAAG